MIDWLLTFITVIMNRLIWTTYCTMICLSYCCWNLGRGPLFVVFVAILISLRSVSAWSCLCITGRGFTGILAAGIGFISSILWSFSSLLMWISLLIVLKLSRLSLNVTQGSLSSFTILYPNISKFSHSNDQAARKLRSKKHQH
jgi:hypothetical protein